jgi:hypothetical protein
LPDRDDKRIELIKDFKFFKTEKGSRVLAEIKRITHPDKSSFKPDPYVTAFNEGQRDIWLHIDGMINLEPEERKGKSDDGR